MELEGLDHVGLAVSDVERSIRWYQEVLGLERAFEEAWGDSPAVLVAGRTGVALFSTRGERVEPSTMHSLTHVGFRASRRGYEGARSSRLRGSSSGTATTRWPGRSTCRTRTAT